MLYYLGIADLPGKMAHSVQEMKMCDAFSRIGENITYLHYHIIGEDGGKITWNTVADYYGLENEFDIKTFRSLHGKTGQFTKLGTLSWVGPIAGYIFSQIIMNRLSEEDIIYGREFYPLYFLSELIQYLPKRRRPAVYFEQHTPVNHRFKDRFYQSIDGVVSITQKLKDYLLNKYSIRSDQILVAPDGVDLNKYCGISKKEAREQLGLPSEENVVMYTGHLYKGKGVETLVQAAKGINSLVYIVGGYDDDIQRVKREVGHPDNVIFTGFVEPSQIPLYQTAADALVAPYTKESRPWISPLKLFEYMAAGRPILASDRDVLREVLVDGETALIFEMGNPESLQEKLTTVLTSSCLRSNLIDNSQELVKKYTWESRARSITRWISSSHKKQ